MSIFKKWDVLLIAALFVSLIVIAYSHVIFFDVMFIKRDIGRYYHPLRFLARQIFGSGGFPFWNPYLFCGVPLFATLQSCVLYPVSLIYYAGNFSYMFSIFILSHLFLAGVFMYLFTKELGVSKTASFFSGVTFAFSGYMIGAINLTISLCAAAWFPLLLYFFKRKQPIFTAAVLLMMLLAGDPAIVYISTLVLFCTAIFLPRYRKTFFVVAGLFLLLSAFQTIPFLEFLRLTDRKFMNYTTAAGWSMPPTDLLSLVVPFFNDINWYFGNYWQVQSWLDNYYLGLIPLFLALVGAFFDKSKKTNFLILFSVFALALPLGSYTAFHWLLYKLLPFFKFIRYPVRFFFLFTFGVAALSGVGLDYFRNNIKTGGRLRRFAKSLFVVSFISVIGLSALTAFSGAVFVKIWNFVLPLIKTQDPSKEIGDLYTYVFMDFHNFKRMLALLSVFGFLFFLGSKKNAPSRLICLAFIGVTVCDLVATNPKYEPTMDIKTYTEPTSNIRFLQKDKTLFRTAVSPVIGHYHIRLPEKTYEEGVLNSKDRLISNRMVQYGIYDISGYDSMYLDRTIKILNEILGMKTPDETRILDMLNVKYICTYKTGPRKKGYRLVNKTGVAYLFENLSWMPRAYLADKAVVIKGEDRVLARLKDKSFDPEKEVILEELPAVPSSQFPVPSYKKESVEIISYKPNEVIIKTSVASSKFLILADAYYPGWKVYVDGKRDKIYRADYILRAVYLKEPGVREIKFKYDPFSFKLGAAISILTLLALMVYYLR